MAGVLKSFLTGSAALCALSYGGAFLIEVSGNCFGYNAGFIVALSTRKFSSLCASSTSVLVTGANGVLGQSLIR